MRAILREQSGHGSYYGCDICVQCATRTEIKQDGGKENLDKRGKPKKVMAWPWEPNCELRTDEQARRIQESIEDGTIDDEEPRYGYKGRSPLLDLPGFDIIYVSLLAY